MTITVHDWLRRAREAADRAEADRCLDAAEALAGDCHEVRAVLETLAHLEPVPGDRLAVACARVLELAPAEREVWGFRDVAEISARHLSREQARAALLAGEASLGADRRTPGYVWVILGEGWLAALGETKGLRRCLEAGERSARARSDADGLVSIAVSWGKHLDRARGVALMRRAEAMASNGTAQPWSMANAWVALDEPRAARRVLLRALRRAAASAQALHVARAFASHGEADGVRAGLRRARDLARTWAEWLNVAEVAFDTSAGEAEIRFALERAAAEAQAGDEEARARVSAAFEDWLGDVESAARLGPRGVRPEALGTREQPLSGWEGSPSALLDWLRARIPRESLVTIARADYGSDEAKHLAALTHIQRTGIVPRRLAWEPHEVLALTRWSSGERVDHLARAFACTLLCLAPGDMDELVSTGPILAESCLSLGAEARDRGAALFVWLAQAGPEEERAAALLLAILLRLAADPDDPRLPALARALLDEHDAAELGRGMAGSMRASLWGELLAAIAAPRADRGWAADLLSRLTGVHPIAAAGR